VTAEDGISSWGCDSFRCRLCGALILQKSTGNCKSRGHSTVWLLPQSQVFYTTRSMDGNEVPCLCPEMLVAPRQVMLEHKCALGTLCNLKSVHGFEKLGIMT